MGHISLDNSLKYGAIYSTSFAIAPTVTYIYTYGLARKPEPQFSSHLNRDGCISALRSESLVNITQRGKIMLT
jgi:hypothetical protein